MPAEPKLAAQFLNSILPLQIAKTPQQRRQIPVQLTPSRISLKDQLDQITRPQPLKFSQLNLNTAASTTRLPEAVVCGISPGETT